MKYKIVIVVGLIIYIFSGCDFSDAKLIVENKTGDSLAFIILNESNYYPTSDADTITNGSKLQDLELLNSIAKYDPRTESKGGVHFISGKSSKNLATFNTTWNGLVESSPNMTLEILFIPAKYMTSGRYKWKELYQQHLFTRKSIRLEELKKSSWKVKYSE
jgi:hypothetical protein